MKHTYGVAPEIRDRTHFECAGIFFNTEQQKSSISDTFEIITPEALVPAVVDRAQGFFVTASGGNMGQAISKQILQNLLISMKVKVPLHRQDPHFMAQKI